MPQLKVAPMSQHWQNLQWLQTVGAHLNTKGGSIDYRVLFLIWHLAHDGGLGMSAPLQKVGLHVIVYLIVGSISKYLNSP